MMEILDSIALVAGDPNLSKAFGIDANNLLTLITGSFIVGYICLTFYYIVFRPNEKWMKLEFFDKAMISLVIGFFSIIISLYIFSVYALLLKSEHSEQLFAQLKYVFPFVYFIAFSTMSDKLNYKELDFIKKYISYSFLIVVGLSFLFLIIILLLLGIWVSLFWIILSILIIVALFIYMRKTRE